MFAEKEPAPASDDFTLQRRWPNGGTEPLSYWGFRNETDPLTDVLLGPADHLRHMATSSSMPKEFTSRSSHMGAGYFTRLCCGPMADFQR